MKSHYQLSRSILLVQLLLLAQTTKANSDTDFYSYENPIQVGWIDGMNSVAYQTDLEHASADTAEAEEIPDSAALLIDSQSRMHERYNAGAGALYLVRPDGYVAYRCPRWRDLASYIDHAFRGTLE